MRKETGRPPAVLPRSACFFVFHVDHAMPSGKAASTRLGTGVPLQKPSSKTQVYVGNVRANIIAFLQRNCYTRGGQQTTRERNNVSQGSFPSPSTK